MIKTRLKQNTLNVLNHSSLTKNI